MLIVMFACLPFSSAYVQHLAFRHVVTVSAQEQLARCPSFSTIEAAQISLQENGFVVLRADKGLLDAPLMECARKQASIELESVFTRLRRLGYDTEKDSFSFDEIVHRSVKRYDHKLDLRRMPPGSPWHDVSAAAAQWAVPVIEVVCLIATVVKHR